MSGIFFDEEEERVAKQQLNYAGGGTDLTLKLFKNDKTPVDGDAYTDYTEADFTGYAAKTLTGSSWSIVAGAPTYASYAKQTFNSGGEQASQYIYGYYLMRGASEIVFAERFTDGPYVIAGASDYIDVTPTLYYKKQGE
jgi:hypothetical protein